MDVKFEHQDNIELSLLKVVIGHVLVTYKVNVLVIITNPFLIYIKYDSLSWSVWMLSRLNVKFVYGRKHFKDKNISSYKMSVMQWFKNYVLPL